MKGKGLEGGSEVNGERPFDAQEIYLSEQRKDLESWRTISLVVALREMLRGGRAVSAEASATRLDACTRVARELTRRGLDATALVRYGMYRDVLGPLIAKLTAMRLAPQWGIEPAIESQEFDHEGWIRALDLPAQVPVIKKEGVRGAAQEFIALLAPKVSRLLSWISVATFRDIVCLTPMADIRDLPQEDMAQFLELQIPYRWVIDHFTQTFLHDWETESLHQAHRWLKGQETPPCPPRLMCDRSIDPGCLAEEIADRAAMRGEAGQRSLPSLMLPAPLHVDTHATTAALVMDSLTGEMTRHAARLLGEGRLREAAAVFEFGVQGSPNNADLYNNWAFCLIPLDPSRSLLLLAKAKELGFHHRALHTYNEMCCLVSLKRYRAALSLAGNTWVEAEAPAGPMMSTIWRPDGPGWRIATSADVRRDLVALAVLVATQQGEEDDLAIWRARLDGLDDSDEAA